jgi:hypothetical protein
MDWDAETMDGYKNWGDRQLITPEPIGSCEWSIGNSIACGFRLGAVARFHPNCVRKLKGGAISDGHFWAPNCAHFVYYLNRAYI